MIAPSSARRTTCLAIGSGSGLIARFRDAKASAKVKTLPRTDDRLGRGARRSQTGQDRQPKGNRVSVPEPPSINFLQAIGKQRVELVSPASDASNYNGLRPRDQTYFAHPLKTLKMGRQRLCFDAPCAGGPVFSVPCPIPACFLV